MVKGAARLGAVLGGAYRLDRMIGEGGMGTVYEASHMRVPRKFAIKLLNAEALANPDVFERFKREAEIASALGEDHIVQVFDFNHTDDGIPYMVLELLHGEDLANRIAARGRLTLAETASVVEQMASALETAHAAGIVHRDLKPQNVFLCQHKSGDDFIKVLDFGISKVLDSPSLATKTGEVFGTPYYMSPEQAQGKQSEIDARTDIFAFGAIAYECLAGQRAFDAPSIVAALYQVCHSEPEPLRSFAPEVPAAVQPVLARAMAKRREDRYPSVGAFCADFLRAAAMPAGRVSGPHRMPSSRGAAPTPTPAMASTTMSGATGQTFDGMVAPRKRRTGLVAGLSVAVIAASVVVVVFALRGSKNDKGPVVADKGASAGAPPRVDPPGAKVDTPPAKADTPPAKADTPPAKVDTPPAKADTPVKADTPPAKADTPPAKADTPPAKADTPVKADTPAKADTPVKPHGGGHPPKPVKPTDPKPVKPTDAKPTGPPDVPALANGTLTVRVTNTWAEVLVDGKSSGNAPLHMSLPPGKHKVTIKNDDKSESFSVTIKPGAPSDLEKTL